MDQRVAFFHLSLPLFVLTPSFVDKSSPTQISKKKKNERDRSLARSLALSRSLSLALSSTKKRFFTPVRDAFSLPPRIFFLSSKSKKKAEKIQNLRAERFHQTRALARAGREREREKKKTTDFSNESNFFLLRGAFCLCFSRSREGEEETLRGGLREREGNGSLSYSLCYHHQREIKKKVTTNFSLLRSPRARTQKRDRATKPTKERTRT